ncbi:MAG TPA: helix-turn-helix transcriptional regulator [Actinomycetota bacterium]|nr:helix-turn-helix transcriptional regulator [Actinomycetota bacterium]
MTANDRLQARELWEEMRETAFPFALIDPRTHVFVDANKEYATLLELDVASVRGLSLLSLYDLDVVERIKSLNASFAQGSLHKTQGRSPLRKPSGAVIHVKGWARRIEGLADHALVVTSAVEATTETDPDDLPWVRLAPQVFGLPKNWAGATPERSQARAHQLEHHLWRIGLEVRSAGLLAVSDRALRESHMAKFDELSPRQREIIFRLVAGERVSEIAQAMHLSPSTVRNHLSAIFRKFGVHSQVELVSVLRVLVDAGS